LITVEVELAARTGEGPFNGVTACFGLSPGAATMKAVTVSAAAAPVAPRPIQTLRARRARRPSRTASSSSPPSGGCRSADISSRNIVRSQLFASHDYGIGWLALLAEAPPSAPGVIFGIHPRGFAAHMARSPEITRFYLQCPPGEQRGEVARGARARGTAKPADHPGR
jgi:hypothetical protein